MPPSRASTSSSTGAATAAAAAGAAAPPEEAAGAADAKAEGSARKALKGSALANEYVSRLTVMATKDLKAFPMEWGRDA